MSDLADTKKSIERVMGAICHRWKFSNEYVLINAAAAAFTDEWQARSQVISVALYTTTSV